MEDYKQKYEQALERAKVINSGTADYEVAVKIFPELKESGNDRSQRIKNEVIEMLYYYHSESSCFVPPQFSLEETLAWLEKQGTKESKKTSIWHHWNDGIAGNREDKLIYLIKNGNDYRLSSSLGFECDYIKLSDLDELMLSEKQGEQSLEEKVNEAMREVEGKAKAFTAKHKGETAEEILAQMRGEQKPAEWIENYWQHHKINNPDSYNKGEEIQFDHDGFVRFCKQFQKPAEWSEEDELNFNQAIYVCHQYQYVGVETWLKSLKQRMKGE